MSQSEQTAQTNNRREFLKNTTAAVAAGSMVTLPGLQSSLFAESSDVIKVGLIGCGGRGSGAAVNALKADSGARLVAMGDAFQDRLDGSLHNLSKNKDVSAQIQVADDMKFVGFDAFKKVVDAVDVVLLTTPPHFRPEHLKYAVEKGKHCFVEKPIAVDAPGVRSVMESCKQAKEKQLSIVSGLCYRYDNQKQELVERIHNGEIGEITGMRCSYFTGTLWSHPRQESWSDMEYQMRNWLYHTWLSGDHINEQHIHSIDKMAWAMKDEPPVSATATGGRLIRTDELFGNVYDHFAVEFKYPNGIHATSRCRQQDGTKRDVTDHIFGTKAIASMMSHKITDYNGKKVWRFRGKGINMYDAEHVAFFASIRSGNPINNGDYMCKSTLMAIMGRMAAYTGQEITWEQALNSKEDLTPPSYEWTDLPVGPIAQPGITPFV